MRFFTRAQLDRAFEPRSIAVVGSSKRSNYSWLRYFESYPGKVVSVHVNPDSAREIEALGFANYRTLREAPKSPDYVIVNTPRRFAIEVFADAVEARVGAVSYFTSGFAEADREGAELQRRLAAMSRESGVPLFGPNCTGIYNPALAMRSMPNMPVGEGGSIGMVSQSGTHNAYFAKALWAWHGLRVARGISLGNGAVLDAADWIEYIGEDERVKILAAYIEGIGERDAGDHARFAAALRSVAAKKPVVVWKGGNTADGARVTALHTGAKPVSPGDWASILDATGAVGVDSMENLVDTVAAHARLGPFHGPRLAFVVLTGGQGPAITDAFQRRGLRVPALAQESLDELATFFNPIGGSYHNPLDAAYVLESPALLARELAILDRDPNIDFVAMDLFASMMSPRRIQSDYGLYKEHLNLAPKGETFLDILAAHSKNARKPFFVISSAADTERAGLELRELLTQRGVLAFPGAERAAVACAKALAYWASRAAFSG